MKYFSDGYWRYLSSDGFTMENANVVCIENTQTSVEKISHQNHEVEGSFGLYPYRINCIGNESSLCDCSRSSQRPNNSYIVVVKCKSSK